MIFKLLSLYQLGKSLHFVPHTNMGGGFMIGFLAGIFVSDYYDLRVIRQKLLPTSETTELVKRIVKLEANMLKNEAGRYLKDKYEDVKENVKEKAEQVSSDKRSK